MQQLGFTVNRILHTHAHLDHFLASSEIKKATGAAICLHQDDLQLWNNLELQRRVFGVSYVPALAPDHWLTDEEKVMLGQVPIVALHTPGHTPGSMSFHVPNDKLLLAGDTLFRGSMAGPTYGAVTLRLSRNQFVSDSTPLMSLLRL